MPNGEPTLPQATLEAFHKRLDDIAKRQAELDAQRAIFLRLGWVKILLSAFTAGMVGFWTPVLAVMALVEPPLPITAWLIGLGGACMNIAKDLRSQLELPPTTNGGVTLPARWRGGGGG